MSNLSDPVRMEIFKNELETIADGMALTVVRTCRSSVVRTAMDFSTSVLTPQGELIGQGLTQSIHLGAMPPALKACIRHFDGRIRPGDILINNDPYEGGSHLPDVFLFKPIFVGTTLACYVCAMSHHTDMGGRVFGSNACDNTEIYQEGLRIPPLKLYDQGIPNETLFRLFEKAVRVPDQVIGDLLGNVAALNFGEREYLRLVEQNGLESLLTLQEELLDYTEELTRSLLQDLPDGEWSFTDYLDNDGVTNDPIAIAVALTKTGDNLLVDFEGTSPQCKGSIQPTFETTKSAVYAVVRAVLGALGRSQMPNTSGYFRPVRVTAPVGCFVNPMLPGATAARGLGCLRIFHAVMGAFSKMLPDKIMAATGGCELGISMGGYDKNRKPWRPWLHVEFHPEQSVGGFPFKDGQDAQNIGLANVANIPSELIEAEWPIKVTSYGFIPDSGGAGKHRGGLGLVREWELLMEETQVQVRSDRRHFPPYGLHGGLSGKASNVTRNPGSDSQSQLPTKFVLNFYRGESLRVEWAGAGGWGNPLDRAPELVLQDILSEKVTCQHAREVYGVVLKTNRSVVDADATLQLRAELGK